MNTYAKTFETFLATYRSAGGLIRVVIVKEEYGCFAFFRTDPTATVVEILEAIGATHPGTTPNAALPTPTVAKPTPTHHANRIIDHHRSLVATTGNPSSGSTPHGVGRLT